MPQGLDHVKSALELIASASDTIGKLSAVQQRWKSAALAKLTTIADLLRTTMDRFFLKTRHCLPFAAKCETRAQELDALLAELSDQSASSAETQLNAALDALESAAKTLDERSLMQGMAIT